MLIFHVMIELGKKTLNGTKKKKITEKVYKNLC